MNCGACGMQLSPGAANCPRCGAPSYYSYSGTAPNDPTMLSVPAAVPQQPLPPTEYGSPPYGAASATPYDPAPYGTMPRDPYGSPSYQNPYGAAPPSPPPQRRGNRTAIIAGAVFLALILIGGGVVGLLAYSSARNAAATAANATATANANATASAAASASAAAQNFTAKGTFTLLKTTTTSFHQDGQNKTYGLTVQAVTYGDVSGPFTNDETSILHPDSTSNFSGTSTCSCTVDGKSGTLFWSFTGTQAADGSFQGQISDLHGTGDLAKLQGQGNFQGQGSNGTYSYELRFAS